MNNDALYNADTFSLTVKDEDDNEIWSTTDVSQIKEYPELDEMMKSYQYKTSIIIHLKKVTT